MDCVDQRALNESDHTPGASTAVLPKFGEKLAEASPKPNHRGALPPLGDAAKAYVAEIDGVTLAVAISAGAGRPTVVTARHQGGQTPEMTGACELFCGLIEGLPIQEAAEHGVLHLIADLPQGEAKPSVSGILMPHNAGGVFILLERLIRAVYRAYLADAGAVTGWNQWNPKMPAEWLRMTKEAQASYLKPLLFSNIIEQGLSPDDIWICDIEKGGRVIVSFAAGVPPERKPPTLMHLERSLRDATGIRLELYVEEMSDKNALRRL